MTTKTMLALLLPLALSPVKSSPTEPSPTPIFIGAPRSNVCPSYNDVAVGSDNGGTWQLYDGLCDKDHEVSGHVCDSTFDCSGDPVTFLKYHGKRAGGDDKVDLTCSPPQVPVNCAGDAIIACCS